MKWIPRSDPFGINAVAMLTAGVMLLAGSLLVGETQAIPARAETWLAVGYITVFGSVVMFWLYLYGLQRWTASAMSYSTLLLPFVSVTVATLLTGERFSVAFAVGGLVMLAGVYVGAFGVPRRRRSTATSLPECIPMADCGGALPPIPVASPAQTQACRSRVEHRGLRVSRRNRRSGQASRPVRPTGRRNSSWTSRISPRVGWTSA